MELKSNLLYRVQIKFSTLYLENSHRAALGLDFYIKYTFNLHKPDIRILSCTTKLSALPIFPISNYYCDFGPLNYNILK